MSRAQPATPPRDVQVHLVSLGCPKNLVDSEMILGGLGAHGLSITATAEDADVIVVNTCGFVNTAKEESIQAILEACELKQQPGPARKVVVTGCLGQRYGEELAREIPELDAIVGLGEYEDLGQTLLGLLEEERAAEAAPRQRIGDPTRACHAEVGRFRLTPSHYGYIKISEGCDNPCTFCAIPSIRGRFRSKPIPFVVEEARELVASGAREIVLISQDTTSYGVDLHGNHTLDRLLYALAEVDGLEWIRVLYAYPAFVTDAMLDAIAEVPNVVPYVDMPLQHIADRTLRRMGRRMNEEKTRRLLARMRERIPGLYLRTTFIVGFPGETEEDFGTLRDFVGEFGFERLGVFPYSPEEGTPSASFADTVPESVRDRRLEEVMLAQQEVAFAQNRERRGEVCRVLVDAVEDDGRGGRVARARSVGEAPEIDPSVLVALPGSPASGPALEREGFVEVPVTSGAPAPPLPPPGEFAEVRIVGARDYDLLAVPAARPSSTG